MKFFDDPVKRILAMSDADCLDSFGRSRGVEFDTFFLTSLSAKVTVELTERVTLISIKTFHFLATLPEFIPEEETDSRAQRYRQVTRYNFALEHITKSVEEVNKDTERVRVAANKIRSKSLARCMRELQKTLRLLSFCLSSVDRLMSDLQSIYAGLAIDSAIQKPKTEVEVVQICSLINSLIAASVQSILQLPHFSMTISGRALENMAAAIRTEIEEARP